MTHTQMFKGETFRNVRLKTEQANVYPKGKLALAVCYWRLLRRPAPPRPWPRPTFMILLQVQLILLWSHPKRHWSLGPSAPREHPCTPHCSLRELSLLEGFKNWVFQAPPLWIGPAHKTRPATLPSCGPAPLPGRLGRAGLIRLLPFPLPPAAGLHSVQRAPGRLAFASGRERTGKRGQELDWEPGKPRESGASMGLGKGRGAQALS